ncbi:hypothetical protein [Inconstantimicrobium mannanitabidum]|uniref:Uncharacterized protein n=1 Tax=Inconstantimicrobium mannanitabidum TaxID=1604901 RepID=A0ACB5RA07_9CLOT|nr:hypothetical protein [Clostridium sp. TW13]GKX65806.1 hypothetical protein rsdtw13_10640 [Clostridium sp. TW13]
MSGYTFSVGEEIKNRAYKELVDELKKVTNKYKELEELEVEYFKKYLLNETGINDDMIELKEMRTKIENERQVKFNLESDLNSLEEKFKSSYGK